jgi:hypothetical protein
MVKQDPLCWGENYPDAEHSLELNCMNQKCEEYNTYYHSLYTRDSLKRFMGVQIAPTPSRLGDKYRLMLECQKCYSHYWFHISEISAEFILEIKDSKELLDDQFNL